MGLFSFLTQEIAIDLGTANTVIIHNDKIVVDEPSIVAIDKNTGKLIAIGDAARQMHGKTHENIKTVRPLRDGVIADFNAAQLAGVQLLLESLHSRVEAHNVPNHEHAPVSFSPTPISTGPSSHSAPPPAQSNSLPIP